MRNRVQTTIFFFDMVISASSRRYGGLKPITATELVSLLSRVKDNDQAIKSSTDGRRTIYLQKVTSGTDMACLLINLSDKDATDPAFSDPIAKRRRVIKKEKEEGLEVSTHIMIKLKPIKPDTYAVIIESAYGLPSGRVQQFLNFNLRKAMSLFPNEFLVDAPSSEQQGGKVQKIKARSKIEFKGHPSNQLISDINAGTLTAVDLIQRSASKINWDQAGYIVEKKKTVALDVSGIGKKASKFNLLREVCDKATQRKMDELRVQFKTATGMHRTIKLDPTTQTTSDEAYVRKEILDGFNNYLSMAYEQINQELAVRMAHLLT